jgi:hypothetical protein
MSDHNLNSTNLTTTGTVNAGRTRIRAIYCGATAGTVELKDGGAGGTTKFLLAMASGQTCDFPGSIEFQTDCHATLTTATSVTFVY